MKKSSVFAITVAFLYSLTLNSAYGKEIWEYRDFHIGMPLSKFLLGYGRYAVPAEDGDDSFIYRGYANRIVHLEFHKVGGGEEKYLYDIIVEYPVVNDYKTILSKVISTYGEPWKEGEWSYGYHASLGRGCGKWYRWLVEYRERNTSWRARIAVSLDILASDPFGTVPDNEITYKCSLHLTGDTYEWIKAKLKREGKYVKENGRPTKTNTYGTGKLPSKIVILPEEGHELRNAAALGAKFIEMVPCNTECVVLDRHKGWFKIKTPSGNVGWLSGYGEVTGNVYVREIR